MESKSDAERSEMWVVGSDGSGGAEHAVRWAMAHGVGRTASIHVLRAWHLPPIAGAEFGVGPLADLEPSEAHAGLDDLAAAAKAAGIDVTTEVRYGGASRVLLDTSEDAALLVVGSRGLGGFRRLLLGSVSHQCATHANGPVVVVRPPTDEESAESAVARIVVGVDGSPAAREALRWAHEFAGGRFPVIALGAWSYATFAADEVHSEVERLFRRAQRSFDATVDGVEAELDEPGCFERRFVTGGPAVVLVDECDPSTLLVVGERGHRGFAGGLLGSVATEVLHRAPCPVTVIPAPHDADE